jgi:hypothetical protein
MHNPRVDVPAAARVSTGTSHIHTGGPLARIPVEQQRAVGARGNHGQVLKLAAFCFSLLLLRPQLLLMTNGIAPKQQTEWMQQQRSDTVGSRWQHPAEASARNRCIAARALTDTHTHTHTHLNIDNVAPSTSSTCALQPLSAAVLQATAATQPKPLTPQYTSIADAAKFASRDMRISRGLWQRVLSFELPFHSRHDSIPSSCKGLVHKRSGIWLKATIMRRLFKHGNRRAFCRDALPAAAL